MIARSLLGIPFALFTVLTFVIAMVHSSGPRQSSDVVYDATAGSSQSHLIVGDHG